MTRRLKLYMWVIVVMEFSVASSYIWAVLHTSRSFLSTLFSICEIKPWSLQPDGHLENFGKGQENRSGWEYIIVTGHSELSWSEQQQKKAFYLHFAF